MTRDSVHQEILSITLRLNKTTDPIEIKRLRKRGLFLLSQIEKNRRRDVLNKLARLEAKIPKVFRDNPGALALVQRRGEGYEKFLSCMPSLYLGQKLSDEIICLAAQYHVELEKGLLTPKRQGPQSQGTTPRTRRNTKGKTISKNRQTDQDKRMLSEKSKDFSVNKFEKVKALNKQADNKDVPMDIRRDSVKASKTLVKRETEFNGQRRNDKLTNSRDSWNEKGKSLASAKGAR